MTVDTQKLRELVDKSIKRAYLLGQNYWRLADSESWSDNRRSNDVQDKFDALHSETVSVASAQVSMLQGEIDRLRAQLNQTASMLQSACLVISDQEARVMALQQVKDAHAVLNPPAPPQGETE